MPFQQLGLPPSLLLNLSALGYQNPTPIQSQAIPLARAGADLIATAQTGTGKTAAFLLPVLERLLERKQDPTARRRTTALVLSPTRELANQIHGVFHELAAGLSLRATLVTGGAAMHPQIKGLRAGADLVVATPGRLLAFLRDGSASLSDLAVLVLDEADQMFDLGFFPDIKQIISHLPASRQTMLFSATMPPEVAKLARTVLRNPTTVSVGTQGVAAASVTQTVYPVPADRKAALLEHLLERVLVEGDGASVLVFTRTRRGAKKLTQRLYDAGHSVGELHADRSPAQRERTMRGFRERTFPILVATNIAARGLDVRHVTHVINFDVPTASDEYVHRIGRTGRAGDVGDAVVLLTPEEHGILARIERKLGKALPRRRLPEFDYGVMSKPTAAKVSGKKPFTAVKTSRHKPHPVSAGRRTDDHPRRQARGRRP